MTQERMIYFASKYLRLKIEYWKEIVDKIPNNAMAASVLEDYQQELDELNDHDMDIGNLTEEGYW